LKLLGWDEFTASRIGLPWSVTIGVFDGVHLGHRKLIGEVRSREPGARSAIVTFKENPKLLLRPQIYSGSISSLGQKLMEIEACGVQSCILIDFSENFGTLSGASFLAKLKASGVGFIYVGPNFHCGHKKDTNAQKLVELASSLGMDASVVAPELYAGHPISSSRIRNAILEGRLVEAEAMLGRPYELELGTDWIPEEGFWKAETPAIALLPPNGTYLVRLERGETRLATLAARSIRVEGSEPCGSLRLAFLESVSQE